MDRGPAPNVVLFISDQQRADTMPGNRMAPLHTPHLDWLSQRGTLFERAYCASPMCSPARASILSGLYPHTTGMVANHQERPICNQIHLPPQVRVLADYLKPLGYACAYAGKWHLGTGGERRGFCDFVTRSGTHEVDSSEQNEMLRFAGKIGVELGGKLKGNDADPGDYDPRTQTGSSLLPLAYHRSLREALQAAGFIRSMSGQRRPFALVYSCHEPHPPFVCPRPFDRMYDPATMPLPETRRDLGGPRLLRHRHDVQLRPAAPFSDGELQVMWAAYCGAVSYVDHLLGLLLEALVDTDQLDDTLLIYTSDHGEMLGSHGMLLKGAVLYEEVVRVPLLIMPPGGGAPPRRTARLASHVDLVPTILSQCGAAVPTDLQGVDIRPLLQGVDEPVRPGVALEFHSSNWGERPVPLRGWVTEGWKFVETLGGDDELYDLRRDPDEIHNLVGVPEAVEERARMADALHAWLRESGDGWPQVPRPEQEVPYRPRGPWELR